MSQREYALKRGVSPEAVRKAVERERISLCRRRDGELVVHPEVADREWVDNTDEAKAIGGAAAAGRAPPAPVGDDDEGEEDDALPGSAPATYQRARATREHFQAELARLTFEERSGRLLETRQVEAQAFELARGVREAIMGIPARIAGELAAETDAATVSAMLTRELRRALEALSGG